MSRTSILTSMLIMFLGTTTVLSQGMYLTLNGGYGLGAGTQSLGKNTTFTGTGSSSEGVYGSFGEGLKLGASAGYMFTRHLGAELGFSYWFGKSISYGSKGPSADFNSVTWKTWGIVAVPSLMLSAGMEAVNPYARLGLVVGLLRPSEEISQRDGPDTMEGKLEESGGIALGYSGALGISIPAGGGVSLFAEAVLHSVTYSPSKYEVTKYVVNLQDQLPSLQAKTVEYREKITATDRNVIPAVRRPFSSIGFAVGARVSL